MRWWRRVEQATGSRVLGLVERRTAQRALRRENGPRFTHVSVTESHAPLPGEVTPGPYFSLAFSQSLPHLGHPSTFMWTVTSIIQRLFRGQKVKLAFYKRTLVVTCFFNLDFK